MPDKHHPKRGSMGFSPRKRAASHIPSIKSWPEIEGPPRIQGFAGYKAGMTHAFIRDFRPKSTTSEQEVQVPVTVIEAPPMKVAGVRFYTQTPYGLRTLTEIWAKKLDKEMARRLPISKKQTQISWAKIKPEDIEDVRLITYTQPYLVTGIPKKSPDIMEHRVGGGSIPERIEYARSILGKEIKITDFIRDGRMCDVASITTGKGFQGHVKRWGVKLLHHKNSKHRRMIGTAGPWKPHYTLPTVPQAGQTGYHQRTEFNKRVLKVGENGEEVTPAGGFIRYGIVKNEYLLIHGSIPGPSKRLIRLRDPTRFHGKDVDTPEITYISTVSNQGA